MSTVDILDDGVGGIPTSSASFSADASSSASGNRALASRKQPFPSDEACLCLGPSHRPAISRGTPSALSRPILIFVPAVVVEERASRAVDVCERPGPINVATEARQCDIVHQCKRCPVSCQFLTTCVVQVDLPLKTVRSQENPNSGRSSELKENGSL